MKHFGIVLIFAAAVGLSACGGRGDDGLGDNAAEAAENRAQNLEAMAENSSGPEADTLDALADTEEARGEKLEEAIDDSDVNADRLSADQKNRVLNGQ
jgi:ABC-type glycerol-3-phosphate transport system substrate-binding protein